MNKSFNSQRNKALLVCVLFLLFFSLIPLGWHRVGDFNFHFEKAGEDCTQIYDEQRCTSYYPLLHFLGAPFSFSPIAFANFLMIIVVFITPLLLFFFTKKWIIVWFYFSVTQYVYAIQAGAYPQALAGVFLLLFLFTKNPYLKFPILVVALLAHSQAFVLLLLVWLVQLFFDNFKSIKSFFPACSAIFGRQDVDPIGQTISIDIINRNGWQLIHVPIKDIANFFVRTFPFPFLVAAIWQLKKEKNYALIAITAIAFYYGVAVGQSRIFLVVPLILLPALTNFYSNLDKKWKKWFVLLSIVTFAINFGTWFLFKVNCVAI